MNPRAEVLWIFTGAAVVILLTSIPMILGMVPRNRWYGARTPKWYAINRKWGIVSAGISAAALLILAGFALL